jgi:hypothetical protein
MNVLTNEMTQISRVKVGGAAIQKLRAEMSEYDNINHSFSRYADLRTWFSCVHRLVRYFRWPRAKGISLNPGELV